MSKKISEIAIEASQIIPYGVYTNRAIRKFAHKLNIEPREIFKVLPHLGFFCSDEAVELEDDSSQILWAHPGVILWGLRLDSAINENGRMTPIKYNKKPIPMSVPGSPFFANAET